MDLGTLLRAVLRFNQRDTLLLPPSAWPILLTQSMQFTYRRAFGNDFDRRDRRNDSDHTSINVHRPKVTSVADLSPSLPQSLPSNALIEGGNPVRQSSGRAGHKGWTRHAAFSGLWGSGASRGVYGMTRGGAVGANSDSRYPLSLSRGRIPLPQHRDARPFRHPRAPPSFPQSLSSNALIEGRNPVY